MIDRILFFFVAGSMIVGGSVLTLKSFGWPTSIERKKKVLRAVRTGLGSTLLVVGLLLIYFYRADPEGFWSQWKMANVIGSLFFVVLPLLGALIVASFIQYSVWEQTRFMLANRLRKVIGEKTKTDKKS